MQVYYPETGRLPYRSLVPRAFHFIARGFKPYSPTCRAEAQARNNTYKHALSRPSCFDYAARIRSYQYSGFLN